MSERTAAPTPVPPDPLRFTRHQIDGVRDFRIVTAPKLTRIEGKTRLFFRATRPEQFIIGASHIMDIAGAVSKPMSRQTLRRSPFQDVISLTIDGVNIRAYLRSAYVKLAGTHDSKGPEAPPAGVEEPTTRQPSNNSEAQLTLFAT